MISYGRLLVAIDGSDASHTAAREALALAGETGAAVDVLHVLEEGRAGALGGEEYRSILEDRGRRFLGDVERLGAAAGVDVDVELRTGVPHEEILACAGERGAHLVVLGRHGANGGGRLLGGVTEKVLRSGQLPALTVRDDDGPTVVDADAVLLPTDGSDAAELAGEHAASLAALAGATVHVVAVADVPPGADASEEFVRNLAEERQAAAERLAGDVRSATGLPVETAVRRGRPAQALRDYVGERDVDAVVMGAHGRSGLSRWLLGSVTERLLRTVEVPVLVVPGA